MGPGAAVRHQDEEQLLCSCLGLLDVRLAEGAKLVDLSPAMFRKPNPKAFELVLYHSYCVVKGKAVAKKNLRGLWPLVEKDRKQSKDFYQKIQEWLKESGRLSDHSLAAFQRNPAGPKVVSFLCDVAHWALEVQHARMCADDVLEQPVLEDPVLLQSLAEPLTAAAEAHNQLQVERLLQLCQEGAQMQQQAEQTASQLKDLYYELTAQLREVHAQEGAEDAQGCSIRLASVLPAQLDLSGGSSNPEGLCSVPGPLQQQLEEVQGLWQQLQGYLHGFEGLRGMVQHLVGTAAHPYAIDAVQLRAYGQAGGIQCTTTAPGAALDIAALVEAWLFDVGSVCRYVRTLAGFTANLEQQQDSRQRGWLAIKPGGIGRCSFMSPLVATSDAASHATHLYAQLSLHRACRDGLLGLKAHLGQHTQQAAAQAEALQAQLSPLFEQQMAQAEADAAAAAAAAQAADMDAAGPQLFGHAPQSAAADGPGHSGHGLFAGSQLQLIPPTPMLQQQVVKEQRRQQHRAAELQGHVQPHSLNSQQLPVPLRLQPPTFSSTAAAPAGSGAGGVSAEAGSSGEEPCLSPVLLPEAGHSPDFADSPHCSSASSAERPAAELLMSRELMDLDLVDSEPGELDDGGVFSTQLSTGRGRGPQGGADMGRISFARFSLGTESFMPFLAAGRAQAAAAAAAAGDGGLMHGAGCSTGGAPLGPVLEDTASDSAGGAPGAESHRSAGTDGAEQQGGSSAAADLQPSKAGGDTPPLDWGHQAPPPLAGRDHVGQSASGSSAAAGVSPSTVQPVGGLDPMAPMSVGSAECLSSAKPRRLTFAAAATSHVSHGSVGCETPLSDTAGSVGASSTASGEEGNEVAEADAASGPQQQQQVAASSTLAALRQRFADSQLRTQQ